MKRKRVTELHKERLKNDPTYAAEYNALEGEFTFAREMIRARKNAQLTQAELAERMGWSNSDR